MDEIHGDDAWYVEGQRDEREVIIDFLRERAKRILDKEPNAAYEIMLVADAIANREHNK